MRKGDGMLKCNVGKIERVIRVFAGLIILGLGLFFGSWWGLVGFIPILTAVIAWCPLYALIGFSTCRDPESTLKDTAVHDTDRPMRINR